MLWYLHLAANAGIAVTGYRDEADGDMESGPDGGRFVEVVLKPTVTIAAGDPAVAQALHDEANRRCFIANSVNFPVRHAATILLADGD
jgi:organic hydroperoxide reductase OsmC/OhrA